MRARRKAGPPLRLYCFLRLSFGSLSFWCEILSGAVSYVLSFVFSFPVVGVPYYQDESEEEGPGPLSEVGEEAGLGPP